MELFLVCFGQFGRSNLRHVTCAADFLVCAEVTCWIGTQITVFDPLKRRYKAGNPPKQGLFRASEEKSFIDLLMMNIFSNYIFLKSELSKLSDSAHPFLDPPQKSISR